MTFLKAGPCRRLGSVSSKPTGSTPVAAPRRHISETTENRMQVWTADTTPLRRRTVARALTAEMNRENPNQSTCDGPRIH
jgi:hypothetical protein